jgi:glycosyltransferase involved in cell wall biosynthesis
MKEPTRGPQATPRIALNAWFLDQPTTGSGQYLAHLLDEYRHSDLGALLLCGHTGQPAPPPGPFEWQTVRTPFDARPPAAVRTGLRRHLAKLWFEQVAFVRASHRWGADLIHVPYWAGPLWARLPTVVTVHDLIPMLLPAYSGGTLVKLYTRLVARSVRRAALILTDSHASRKDILTHLGVPPERVEAIPLAAGERYRPVRDEAALEEVREKYALPSRYLLYLGGFEVRKNLSAILRAYARLDPRDVALVIAGRLPTRTSDVVQDPRPLAAELGIAEQVRFCGWVDEEDKPALYGGALAFLFPSTYEGFGLPPLEAMSCGTPVIVSDRASLPEIAGDAGLYVAPDDVDGLAQAMHKLASDPDLRQALSRAALAQSARFTWPQTARATLAAYHRTLASPLRLGPFAPLR